MKDLLAVALGHHTTPHSTIALGVARAQLIGGYLLGTKALRHGWWERKWVPIPFVAHEHPKGLICDQSPEVVGENLYWPICGEWMPGEPPGNRGGRGKVGSVCNRRRVGWRRMATDGTQWWDSDFPDRNHRARMVRKHLAAAVQQIRDATGYDVITEENLDDAGKMVCPATWQGLLLCKRVLEIAAVAPRAWVERVAAE